MTHSKTYKIADMVNGAFGEVFTTLNEAETALQEAIEDGAQLNAENGDDNAEEKARSFFCIVDAETGEEV